MRLNREKDGTYSVEDTPIRIEGAAAERFLNKMAEREQRSDPERKRFLDECQDSYDRPPGGTLSV